MESRSDSAVRTFRWWPLAILVPLPVLFWPTFVTLHGKWSGVTNAYSHGYLIVLISCGLILRAAARPGPVGGPSWPPLLGLAGASLLWFAAWVADIMIVQALLLPGILFLALTACCGLASWKTWVFPAGYLVFAVPVWDYVNGILQAMTIAASTAALHAASVPAFIEGSFVYLASGTFEIASGCAGLSFLIVGLALSTLYAYLYLETWLHRVLLVAVAAAASIVMNWFRVSTIIYAGYATDMQHYLVTVDHYNYGWALFALMMLPLYGFARRLELREAGRERSAENAQSILRPVSGNGALALLLVASAAGPALMLLTQQGLRNAGLTGTSVAAPMQLGDWVLERSAEGGNGIEFEGSDASRIATYRQPGGREILFFANNYTRQQQGAELISTENRLYDRKTWTVERDGRLTVDNGAESLEVSEQVLVGRDGRRRLQVHWYDVGGKAYVTALSVKFAEVVATLRGHPQSGVRLIAIDCEAECGDERRLVATLLASEFDAVHGVVRQQIENMEVNNE